MVQGYRTPTEIVNPYTRDRVSYDPAGDPGVQPSPVPVAAVPRSPKWPAVRDAWLRRSPVCAACGARTALTAHHVVPYHVDPSRELDPANLITLCECPTHNCHFIFGHFLRWSAWNPDVVATANAYRGGLERSRTPKAATHVEEDPEDVCPPHSE